MIEEIADLHAQQFVRLAITGGDGPQRAMQKALDLRDELYVFTKSMTDSEAETFMSAYDARFIDASKRHTELERSARFDTPNSKRIDPDDVRALARRDAHEIAYLAHTGGDALKRAKEIEAGAAEYAGALVYADTSTFFALYKHEFYSALQVQTENLSKGRTGRLQDPQRIASPKNKLTDLAVSTAVRATVWESVRAIFRMFR